jgi:two-component system chemotaxis response regulator CheY
MKKILIVDDSITARAIFKASLPENLYEVIEASDVDTALKQATEEHPDLYVMDYNLPDMNGTEIAEKIMEAGISEPFILMTANMQQGVIDRAKSLGFIAFVEKPINSTKLIEMLDLIKWEH